MGKQTQTNLEIPNILKKNLKGVFAFPQINQSKELVQYF